MSSFTAGALTALALWTLVFGLYVLAKRVWFQMPMPDEEPLSQLQATNRQAHRALRRRTPVVRRITIRRGARTLRNRKKSKRK